MFRDLFHFCCCISFFFFLKRLLPCNPGYVDKGVDPPASPSSELRFKAMPGQKTYFILPIIKQSVFLALVTPLDVKTCLLEAGQVTD